MTTGKSSVKEQDTPKTSQFPLSELGVRVLSGVVLVVIALLISWAGGPLAVLAVSILGIFVLREWERLTGSTSPTRFIFGTIAIFSAGLIAFYLGPVSAAAVATSLLFCALASALLESRLKWTFSGLAYAVWLVVSLISLRGHDTGGLSALLLIFAIVWTTDTAAYFGGRALGGPKLLPSVSPNKTWAGAISGVLATILVTLAYLIWNQSAGAIDLIGVRTGGLSIILACLLAAFLSMIAQLGDLFESGLKRRFGAKDSGNVLPGHGGLMDRVDGLVFASTAAFLIGLLGKGSGTVAGGLLNWGVF